MACEEPDLKDDMAKAQVYAACRQYEAVEKAAVTSLATWAIQEALALTIATLEYKNAKQAQDRMDDQWQDEKAKGKIYFDHWNENARLKEVRMIDKVNQRELDGYTPDYDTAEMRALASVNREYAVAADAINRESSIYCDGARRYALRNLEFNRSRAAVSMTNQVRRSEEARKEIKEAQNEETLYKWLALARGSVSDSTNALNGARQAAMAAAKIDPFSGFTGAIAGLGQGAQYYNEMRNAQSFQANPYSVGSYGGGVSSGASATNAYSYYRPTSGIGLNGSGYNMGYNSTYGTTGGTSIQTGRTWGQPSHFETGSYVAPSFIIGGG